MILRTLVAATMTMALSNWLVQPRRGSVSASSTGMNLPSLIDLFIDSTECRPEEYWACHFSER